MSIPTELRGTDIHGIDIVGWIENSSGETVQSLNTISSSQSNGSTLFGTDVGSKLSGTPDSSLIQEVPDYKEKFPEYSPDQECGGQVDVQPTDDDDPLLKDLPWHVRRVVSLTDDTTLPTITFRYFVLTLLFVIPGAFLSQMAMYRTTSAPYSIFFVQIGSNYVGQWLANMLPAWQVRIPFTSWRFSLNPGPFSVKEHVLVVIAAASGATYNLAYSSISVAELWFDYKVHPMLAISFMWAVTWIGYSYAAIARSFLVYDPQYPWFQALCQSALFETQKKQRENPSPVSRRQTIVFFLVLLGVFLWQFLPAFVFPMLSSLAFLCWVAPNNKVVNFVGSGLGGMGVLNLSFDWSNIGNLGNMGSMFLTPWWTQVIVFVAFVFNCWVLIPASKWGGMTEWNHRLMSNRLFQGNGTLYPIKYLITSDHLFNQTAYEEYGPIYIGAQQLWGMFFDYASFTSAFSWIIFFGWPHLQSMCKKWQARRASGWKTSVNEQYHDQLNVLMRSYEEVPIWWFVVLFLCSSVPTIIILARGYLFIPIWTYFVAILTGAVVVIPLGWLYALSNFQLPTGSTNELLYGLMVNSIRGYKNPVGAPIYGTIAGDAWYRAQYMLQDQKIGHYMHIPPKAVFFSQVFGSFIGIPMNYAAIRWILDTKGQYLTGELIDPRHQWTGQDLVTTLSFSTQYVLIGPRRLFEQALFHPVAYGFLAGAATPMILFLLHRKWPNSPLQFPLWNTTIFFCAMSTFYGNISTGYLSALIGGFVVMYWAYRYHYEFWARYNYILAGAFDAGFNFNMLFIFLVFGAGKVIEMPHWWGNDAKNIERCFAME